MTLVTRAHSSGLLVAETRGEEAGLRHALKQLDDRLVLMPPGSMCHGDPGPSAYWRVYRTVSDDRPPMHVLTWMDTAQNPLPLSSGIVDEVQRHRRDSRNQGPTADERNATLTAQVKREREEAVQALHDEYEPSLERGRIGVSLATRNKVPYWQRRHRGGYQ